MLFAAGLFGLASVSVLIPLILHLAHRARSLRSPELHHTHTAYVPRLGGIALATAFVGINTGTVMFVPEQANLHNRFVLCLTSLAMFGLGVWDDLRRLGAKRKLLGQILIALVVCLFGIGITRLKLPLTERVVDLGGWGVVLTVLWLVGMTNLINLIDGVDGLAGGICLMLMALLAYVGHRSGNFELLASCMAGGLLGFLWFNFPPARIYLGDGGAYFLGFQIGFLALVSSQKGTIVAALVSPLFVLALPIVDMLLAICRRGLRGLPIFRPDRKHLHHRLLEMGLSRRRVVLSIYGVTLVFLIMGFLAFISEGQLIPALAGISVLILLMCAGKMKFSREWFAIGRVLGNSLELRQDVQYALALTRWLALEGARRPTLESLWPDLVFVSRRLGFTSVSLTLPNASRVWRDPEAAASVRSYRQELRSALPAVLELAVSAPSNLDGSKLQKAVDASAMKRFEILSELIAEGWLKATKGWGKPDPVSSSLDPKRFALDNSRRSPLGTS